MTIEEQIMKLQTYKMFEGEDTVYVEREDVLKLLEQRPCEDCISREAAIDALRDAENHAFNSYYKGLIAAHKIIANLPSVTPKFTDSEIQKMQELEQAQLDKAYELGKAEVQPCDDCISRAEALKHSHIEYDDDGEGHRVVYVEDLEELPSVTPQTSEDCISRTELLSRIDAERKHLLAIKMDGAEHIIVHHARRIIEDMPAATPTKAELWSRLYIWLNDMHLGISPDEFTPDDERKCRTAQTDIIEDVMGWIEANVFEPKAGSEGKNDL